MKSKLLASAVAVAFAGAIGVAMIQGVTAAPTNPAKIVAADRIDNFALADQTRLSHELYYFKNSPAIVIMSQTNGSKVSRAAAAELSKLQASYKDKGVLFYMLNSNLSDSREKVAAEAKAQGFDIPVLIDERQLAGEQMGVKREGEIFVIQPKTWKVVYHGPIDDRFAAATPNAKAAVKDAYAAKAIDAVLSGSATIEKARVDLKAGKEIAFPLRAKADGFKSISYSKTVAPILKEKCVSCHEKGGIAPFALDSYDVVKSWAPMMRESVRTGRMPPYFADPHIGKFQNDQGLTAQQSQTLVHWIEAGAPRGEGSDLLKDTARTAPEWPEELGKPDVIVDIPAFDVPASGIIPYQNPTVANPFKGDTWLKAMVVKPGELSVLHHVTSSWRPDRNNPGPRSELPAGSVGSYTPGARPQVIAEGAGAPVPAGGTLAFQMHYTTNGKAATDKTQVGYYLLKEKPKYVKRSAVISDGGLMIPKGVARHKEVAYLTFPADAELYTLYPHSHYRGYHVELKSVTPDGKETMLLSLPKYDFNWQRDYDPVKPIQVKAGTKLVATWVYDNSVNNPANPDPTIDVRWGEQSHQEMMYFRVNYRWMDETTDNLRNDIQSKLMESAMIGGLDDNYDNKIEKSELKGTMASFADRFDALDLNKDGGLDRKEMEAGGVSRFGGRRGRGPVEGLDGDL